MPATPKLKKRGFVMTGGGAKGFYEAGVIHAFHISGMEFDVITGSSIGAMNSVFFAEYLYQKRQLAADVRSDPLQSVEAMDHLVKAYHHAWLQMSDRQIVDDSPTGPIGRLKDDLEQFNLDLPLITRLGWWWTDPDRKAIPPAPIWPALARLVAQLVGRLGGTGALLRIFKNERKAPIQAAARTYLARFGMERSLVTPADDHKLKDIFTQPISPLTTAHLTGDASASDAPGTPYYRLVEPTRSLGDYARAGITVRLTRANYRTGRLEISSYMDRTDFMRYLDKQAWRLKSGSLDGIPLGSFRLQTPGNPNAVNAGLCSGRFPGVFFPYPIASLYPETDPENALLYHLLKDWPAGSAENPPSPSLQAEVGDAYRALHPEEPDPQSKAAALFAGWRDFFPKAGDTYVDGGTIDNTPSNSAVDFTREWAERQDLSKREIELELFVIFLSTEPKVSVDVAQDPAIFQVVSRTLQVQGVAKNSADSNTVDTINTYGQRSEDLLDALEALLASYEEALAGVDADQKRQAGERLFARLRQQGLRLPADLDPADPVGSLRKWSAGMARKLPLHVEAVKVFPQEMPLGTLQFTERLGYRKDNAIRMLAMGCFDTLWALRTHLETDTANQDDQDRQSLALARKWMGFEALPRDAAALASLKTSWRCQRTGCAFYNGFCAHGKAVPAS
jgi:hypothetical protein